MKAWIARDCPKSTGGLNIFSDTPHKSGWFWIGNKIGKLDPILFPQIEYEDEEPTEAELEIKIKKGE